VSSKVIAAAESSFEMPPAQVLRVMGLVIQTGQDSRKVGRRASRSSLRADSGPHSRDALLVSHYLSVKNVRSTLPFSPMMQIN
jgi:hypothetical protein